MRLAVVAIGLVTAGVASACSGSSTSGPSTLSGSKVTTVEPVAKLPGRWKTILDENFSGKTLNANRWQTGWFKTGVSSSVNPNNDLSCNSSKQVTVSGGYLRITAKRQKIKCPNNQTGKVSTRKYVSGVVSSNPTALGTGKGFSFTYGLLEFRARIAGDGKGKCADWPSLWTNGQTWPTDGELDVYECLNANSSWNIHSGPLGGASPTAGGDPKGNWTGWHTFAVNWEPGKVTVYYDGKKIATHTYVSPHPNYIVITNELRIHTKLTLPETLEVDWVRVFQHSSAPSARPITLKAAGSEPVDGTAVAGSPVG